MPMCPPSARTVSHRRAELQTVRDQVLKWKNLGGERSFYLFRKMEETSYQFLCKLPTTRVSNKALPMRSILGKLGEKIVSLAYQQQASIPQVDYNSPNKVLRFPFSLVDESLLCTVTQENVIPRWK